MSAKNLDRHNRWRSKTVAFRMSPEEADQLDTNVSKVNEKLSRENENLRAENRNYKLLRKVFGHKQIYDLLDRAKLEKQSKQREKRFRNYKDER